MTDRFAESHLISGRRAELPAGAGRIAAGHHSAEIQRILRRQEFACQVIVFACLTACTLVLIAIWYELTS